jgi:hypothetical protein
MVLRAGLHGKKMWITAQKPGITRAECGKVAQLFGFEPLYLDVSSEHVQNMDRTKMSVFLFLKRSKKHLFSQKFSTVLGKISVEKSPLCGVETISRPASWVFAFFSTYPHCLLRLLIFILI